MENAWNGEEKIKEYQLIFNTNKYKKSVPYYRTTEIKYSFQTLVHYLFKD